ncbi:universal stress protein [Acetobacteraceae bacterium ESL0709]|nr:universal stress protein [Acetobacteraceae bacterium ESL0697]MDF7678240.1 universal stress protein [Acetobacteraceae bacterium ESL0709]
MNPETRNILLPLTSTHSLQSVFDTGLMLARRYRVRISCILFNDRPGEITAMAGEGMAAAAMTDMIETAQKQSRHSFDTLRNYLDQLQEQGKIIWYDQSDLEQNLALPPLSETNVPQITVRYIEGTVEDILTWQSRLADIILVPPLIPGSNPHASDVLHAMLYDGSQPVIIAPPKPPTHVGEHIAIAWNGTAESALALRNVLPWARKAGKVTVVTGDHYQRLGPDIKDALNYLELHGITATSEIIEGSKRKIGETILRAAHDLKADLLSMGAYSHSRLRQRLLGGVTRYMLENGDMTIMMSR